MVKVEYGFQFEGSFISQYVFGKSMHLKNEGVRIDVTMYDAETVLGNANDIGIYFNSVRYLEMIYGRTLVWQTGDAR